MTFTIPLLINEVVNCELPFSLYKDNNFEIFLAEFSITDKETLFDVSNLKIEDTKATYKPNISSHPANKFSEFLCYPYRILVRTQDDSEKAIELFNKFSSNLDFCCQLYFDYPITLTIFGEDKMSKSQHSIPVFKRKAAKILLDIEALNSFKKTLLLCITNETVSAKKRRLLYTLLNTSNIQAFNSGLTCSSFISILESLFTDGSPEISYKFTMRMTKYLNKDLQFLKKIKELYGKRSKYYHSGEKQFDHEEEMFLSELTRNIIIDYIQNPGKFEIEKLDERLIS